MRIPGYRDLTVLGRGGFSTVYRALQESVQRDVALKVLTMHLAGADAKARFSRECATNGRVGTHPNIVTLFDSGFADDGSPYLAMQLCSGGSLSERLRATGPLPVADVLRVGVKISAALQYAHSAGVLHRDIKPENILISDFGEPELADFGISSVDDHRLSTVTASSFTINHAAPETLAGHPSSVASDVYSLSSTLFTLVAGHTPFTAPTSTSVVALVNMVMNDAAPTTGRSDVPASLEQLLAAGLSKTPAGRPADAKTLGSALQEIQQELGLAVTEFPSAPPPLAYSPTQILSGLGGAAGGAAAAGAAAAAAGVAGAGSIDTGALPATGAMPGGLIDTGALPATGAMPGGVAGGGQRPVGEWGAWAAGQQPNPGNPADRDRPGNPAGVVPPILPPPDRSAAVGSPDRRPDRRAWWILVAVLVVLIAGAGVYALTANRTPSSSKGTGAVVSSAQSSRGSTRASASPPPTSNSSSSAKSTSAAPTTSTSKSTSAVAADPVIESFGSSSFPDGGTVECTSGTSSVNIPMTWATAGATRAWVAIDATSRDASQQPYNSNVPTAVGTGQGASFSLPFACSDPQHVFTLTVSNAAGAKASRSMTLIAKLPATTTSQTSTSQPTASAGTTTAASSSTSVTTAASSVPKSGP